MAIFTNDELENSEIPEEIKELKTCFFCGEPLSNNLKDVGGIICWRGESLLSLHQICAEELGLNLIKDSRTLVSKTGNECKFNNIEKRDIKSSFFYYDNIKSK